MPNWCTNILKIRGTKKNVIKFINKGLKTLGTQAKTLEDVKRLINLYNIDNADNPLKEKCETYHTSYFKDPYRITYFGLSAFLPLPKLFRKYDTTNEFRSRYEKGTEEYKKELSEFESIKKRQKNKYGVIGWYDWNIANYGCKWAASINFVDCVEYNANNVELYLHIETPWSPCYEWLNTIQQQNKYVRFWMSSEEPGMMFKYEYEAENFDADPTYFKATDPNQVYIHTIDLSDEYEQELKEEYDDEVYHSI